LFGGVLLRGYGRELELEADTVGAEYMAKAGYSPDAMLKTIEILKNKDRIEIEQARLEKRQPNVYHGILSTHPDSDTRYKEAVQAAAALTTNYEEYIQADEFLEKLNGMSYGNPRQSGVVRGTTFFHPKLGIDEKWCANAVANRRCLVCAQHCENQERSIGQGICRGVFADGYSRGPRGLDRKP
jgi:predicted Zn-dependent protease